MQFLPLNIILTANKHDLFNTVRVLLRLRTLFKNRVIYNYSILKLSQLSGLSRTCIRKHLPIIIKQGWATIQGNNLKFTGINKLKKHEKETCVPILISGDKNTQLTYIKHTLIVLNLGNQQKAIKEKSKIISQQKVSKAVYNKHRSERSINNDLTLSNRKFGKLFNKSESTGKKLQSRLRKLNLIKSYSRYIKIKDNGTQFEAKYLGGMYKVINGALYVRTSNGICLCKVYGNKKTVE